MKSQPLQQPKREQGAALIVSLIIMVVILVLTANAARFSTINLKMAVNEEIRVSAQQTAQAVVDGALLDGGNTAVRGSGGFTSCTPSYPAPVDEPCDAFDVVLPSADFSADVAANNITFRSRRSNPALVAPPRGIETSIRAFDAAPFDLEAQFDKLDERQGRSRINEGLILLVPKY